MQGLILAAVDLSDSWWDRHGDQTVTVAVALLLTWLAIIVVNRLFSRRTLQLAAGAVSRGDGISRETDTRLRFIRRIVDVTIVIIGLGVAMSQVAALDKIGSTFLASSAIAAAVIGFAARQVLANAIAGIQLAITQPLRIGDLVTFEDNVGTVEDIRLASTWLRTPTDQRVVIPNERLAAGILRNDSIVSATVAFEVSIWLPASTDAVAAVDVIREDLGEDVRVRIAETTAEGTRLLLMGDPVPPATRVGREAELREQGLRSIARNLR